jgi:hypothetical protein
MSGLKGSNVQNLAVKRSELKYYINKTDYHSLVSRLKHILKVDGFSVPHQGYFIRSLYFDGHDDECLYEKQSGIQFRKKYRLRIYDINSDKVKFEIKNKENNQIFKETATISRETAQRVIDGQYSELLKYNNPVLNKIYSAFVKNNYKPKVIVDYDRDAFVYDHFNIRITIDKALRSNNTNLDFFSPDLHMMPTILEAKEILEIKYDQYLPDFIHKILQVGASDRMAISKYALSRRFFKTSSWEDS